MKRNILVATLLVTVAGVASANLLASQATPPSAVQPQPVREAARETAPVVVVAQAGPVEPLAPAVAPVASAANPAAPTVQKASVEARQAPVPLLMKPRPPVELPAVDAKAGDGKKGEAKAGETPGDQVAGTDAFNENAARTAIEADGYKGVKVLRKGVNGVWHATAMRGKTPVTLTVDARGSVSTD